MKLAPEDPVVRTVHALVDAMHSADRGAPTIDTAIVALAAALGLPTGSALGMFAIGRSAGWVAHILEQYEAGYLLRPRARYLGNEPHP
jgi:citrate synthase